MDKDLKGDEGLGGSLPSHPQAEGRASTKSQRAMGVCLLPLKQGKEIFVQIVLSIPNSFFLVSGGEQEGCLAPLPWAFR